MKQLLFKSVVFYILALHRIILHKMRLNGIVHLKIAKSGSEPTQQKKQLNLLRKNRTLASLQLDKQDTTMLIKQRVATQYTKLDDSINKTR